jgi:outer membrane protein OmpA-like peptidoglycan-associated protein
MKMFKTSTILAATGALLLAASASASMVTKEVVHSTNGMPVVDSFGDCVLTNWDSKSSDCTAGVSADVELRTVYFAFNSSALTPAAKTKLDKLSKTLSSKHVHAVKIVGFTDEIGTQSYNLRLSQRRANSVAAYLKGKGIVVKGHSEVRGLGESASKSQCTGVKGNELKACLWRDRRVEVEIVN